MKSTLLILFVALGIGAAAQGYEIKVTLKPFKNQWIYLGHYYGKQLPIIDSVKLNAASEGVFRGKNKLPGGIYLIGYPDRAQNFEFLVDKSQKFSIQADSANPQIRFTGSPENTAFLAYQSYMAKQGRQIDALNRERLTNKQDSVKIVAQMNVLSNEVKTYRNNIITKEPNSLLAVLLTAMKEPEVPKDVPGQKKDSLFAYKYYKAHYWDGVNFYDDRLLRTPFFEGKLDRYFEQLVYPSADSVIHELDWMLGYASINEEMQKFLLIKFTNRYLNQKFMWEDAVFVHLFEKYFAQKDYSWLNEQGKKLITDRAYSLMANIMGNPASDIELPDTASRQTALYNLAAAYTLVAIWDPTCGHCKEVLPRLDSAYQARWKGMGLKMFAMAKETEGSRDTWLRFIRDHKLKDWTHVYYSKAADKARVDAGVPGYGQLYDVQSFPTLYLLDKDKRIIAKKITQQQVDEILAYKQKNQ